MAMSSLLASLPKGFFSWPIALGKDALGRGSSPAVADGAAGRKRVRGTEGQTSPAGGGSGGSTVLASGKDTRVPSSVPVRDNGPSLSRPATEPSAESLRPVKRRRREAGLAERESSPPPTPREVEREHPKLGHSGGVREKQYQAQHDGETPEKRTGILSALPQDVVSHCLSFVGGVEDRFALQTTCKTFRDISNTDDMLARVNITGDRETGKNGIIRDEDTPASAASALSPFARAGNIQALYMLGIVKCYCYQDLKNGILMLKMASSHGYVRSSYTLGIILRDALPEEASLYMNQAASTGYLPALQEVLPAREMKERFGEPNADELRQYLDPMCLNKLLLRDYIDSAELRGLNTSHCWNPLCGRWAYKATSLSATRVQRQIGLNFDLEDDFPIADLVIPPVANRTPVALAEMARHEDLERHRVIAALSRRASILAAGPNRTSSPARSDSITTPKSPTSVVSIESDPLTWNEGDVKVDRVSRMKMCSRCCRAKYCSKLCQVYDWRSSQHKMECQFL